MTSKSTSHESFDAELNGQDVYIEFDRVAIWSSGMEGQDADGNRGMWMTSVDEDYAEHIMVTMWLRVPGVITKEIATEFTALPQVDREVVQKLVDDYLEKHEPTEPENDEPDYEPDDEER
jgi:hypothetical protein